ncbi:hypothetical protein N7925_14105 [Streptomyces sp. CA-278952]|uniref:hypothetical protein n=1 Tax=Streptomyces sp. CA-278952 TaxID=2980556 RepID=UPI002368C095|nr:hypothetical protein [Streptomyces sp. CA-278952]WDG29404.1 hypothetical protein N7925_14105 [Streptomyces sp. CA-278952]
MTLTTSGDTAMKAEQLYEASRRAITLTADDLWPGRGAVLGPQCPSVTSYVCSVTVDGEEMYAKYSWLGSSLVSILRGARGTWDDVLEAQHSYTRSADLVTRREYQHLEFLRELGRPRVCEGATFRAGVLFTKAVPGTTVAEEITARPWDTAALLDSVLLSLKELHGDQGARYLRGAWPINERNIVDVFLRKFNGPAVAGYVVGLGRDSGLPENERLAVVGLIESAVRRLLRLTTAIPARHRTAVFGDLKPEHVILGGHRLTFIDPALQWAAGPQPDVAKLCGRTLMLALCHHELRVERQITQGGLDTLSRYFAGMPKTDRVDRLREVMVLWLMDTTNYLTSCLSAPSGFPLSAHQRTLMSQGRRIATVVDRVSGLLIGSMTGLGLIDAIFNEVEHTTLDLR